MKNRFLIAVSGGPDSMALLDMQRKTSNYIEVAHVNYRKRDSAIRDEKIVKDYCKKYSIKFNKLDFNNDDCKGNFQAVARETRYTFFAKLCNKHNLQKVLVAHHKDDNIETYLMQLDKKLGVNHYGISENSYLYGVFVSRPLLKYTKQELADYCDKNKIVYGIDESNLSNNYERNRVRHNRVEKMSNKQKDKLVKEIDRKNKISSNHFHKAVSYIKDKDVFEVKEFLNIPYIKEFLRKFFTGKSDKYFDEMLRQLKEAKSCKYITNGIYLVKEYDHISFFARPNSYEYRFDNLNDLKTRNYDYFRICKRGDTTQGVTLTKKDFPIVIRNVQDGDCISMKYGKKKLNRFFIDNKVCLKDRLSWPIVVNKQGNAILVPGLGCDVNHYSIKHNIFVIKL